MLNFDGYILKWPEFWDIYESSVHRQGIPNVMKFSYLKGALCSSAAMAITGISVTNENYDVTIRILQEGLEIKSQSLKHYMQRLPMSSDRFGDIKHTCDVIDYCDSWNHKVK